MLALLVALAPTALAQEAADPSPVGGFDAHGFKLAAFDADLRDPLAVQRPGVFSQGDWFLSGLAEYAKSPLVQVMQPGSGGPPVEAALVDNLLALNISAGIAAHERLRFDVFAPVYGLTTNADQLTEGPAMGDIRLSVMGIGIRPKHQEGGGGGGLGLVGHLDLPSGTPSRFLGQPGVGGGVSLVATGEADLVTFTGQLGTDFHQRNEDLANLDGSDRLIAGMGFGIVATETVGLTVEAVAKPALEANLFTDTAVAFPAEGILSMRYRAPTGGHWTFGGAGGITDGPGVPSFRVFVGGGFGHQEPALPPDYDPIGELRSSDLCPLEKEVMNGWKDDDGCSDSLSALVVDVRYDGESRASDAEITGPTGPQMQRVPAKGMSIDAVPGTAWSVRATSGCLTGTADAIASEEGTQLIVELQPIFDSEVQVSVTGPDEKPLPDAQVMWISDSPECVPMDPALVDPATGVASQRIAHGTHTLKVSAPLHNVHEQEVTFRAGDVKRLAVQLGAARISIEKKQIRILEKVQFETGKAVIKPESFPLLNEIAAVVITNPDLGRVEVGGHTDSKGSESYNQGLSEKRAASVRDYLLAQRVDASRLIAVGYGEGKPIDSNKTADGREVNRRVEFNLIDVADDDSGSDAAPGGAQ